MSTPASSESCTFESFGLDPRVLAALAEGGFETPTAIQAQAIPKLLAGHDVIGRSRTGSGKTAAFALPALERIGAGERGPRVLVLAPTRELAMQVTAAVRGFARQLPVRVACIYGGASYAPQLKDLKSGAQFIVATPGRLMDHMARGNIDLSEIETLVLDEADEMLRMGFIEDVEAILSETPDERQVALFSATMPPAIARIAKTHLRDPVEVQVESSGLSTDHITQRWMMVPIRERLDTLVRVLQTEERGTTLIFARTRRDCGELAEGLGRYGIAADALHGALNQPAREQVLQRMRARQVNVVVATDVAARGIDVAHITHVINLHLPTDVETYVHRIGRTGRAGKSGVAISFATRNEARRINGFERSLKTSIELHNTPSRRDVALRKRERLRAQLESARVGDLSEVEAWLQELREAGWSDADLALAAMQLVSELTGIDLGPLPPEEERPKPRAPKAREAHRGERAMRSGGAETDFDAVNEVQIILFTGANFGVRPGDLVGAIANELDIPGSRIGKVTVLDRKCFVGLPREVAELALSRGKSLVVRGRSVRIDLARSMEEGPPSRRAPRGGDEDEGTRFKRAKVSGARSPKRARGAGKGGPPGAQATTKSRGKPKGKFKAKGRPKGKAKGRART